MANDRTDPSGHVPRGLTWLGWVTAVVAAFGLGALVSVDVHATFAFPVLGEFYALVLALTCTAAVTSGGALLARWAVGWIRAEIAGLRAEIAALRDKQSGYADGVAHGVELVSAGETSPVERPASVSVLRQRGHPGAPGVTRH